MQIVREKRKLGKKQDNFFERIATKITCWTGSSAAFLIAFGVVLFWAVSEPLFHFSDTKQLVINTGTTIFTFLIVFNPKVTE